MSETWQHMTDRHKRERRVLVLSMVARRITQTDAAKLLEMSHRALNNYAQRNGIFWPVKHKSKPQ